MRLAVLLSWTAPFHLVAASSSSIRIPFHLSRKHGCVGIQSQKETIVRGGASASSSMARTKTMSATKMKILNLFSGGAAGSVAACITNPLEVVKTQLQSSSASFGEMSSAAGKPLAIAQRIYASNGIGGFFRGLRPTLLGIIPSRSAYFYVYDKSKKSLAKTGVANMKEGSVLNALISGLGAGIAGNTLTNPIWMVRTRMQLIADGSLGQRNYGGYYDAISTIAREEGIAGFYKGIMASYWGCAEGAIQFIIYEKLKAKKLNNLNSSRSENGLKPVKNLSKLSYFTTAAFAKCVAAISVYPHEVARTRLREQARGGVFKYTGMWQTLGVIAKEEGRNGLYAGMGMHLLKVVPNSAIMFLTYELVNTWLEQFTVLD